MSKELFFRMRESEYMDIPQEMRERYLSSKRVDSEINDWSENMEDKHFSMTYAKIKVLKKELEERQFQLRELRRNSK